MQHTKHKKNIINRERRTQGLYLPKIGWRHPCQASCALLFPWQNQTPTGRNSYNCRFVRCRTRFWTALLAPFQNVWRYVSRVNQMWTCGLCCNHDAHEENKKSRHRVNYAAITFILAMVSAPTSAKPLTNSSLVTSAMVLHFNLTEGENQVRATLSFRRTLQQ